ncbi:hypothetical protein GB882_14670, partial [Georgenia ruanii]|nr:hypothetical protein [Georgenia ruanii]
MAAASGMVPRRLAALVVALMALTACTGEPAVPRPAGPALSRVEAPMAAIELSAELGAAAASWGWSLVASDGSEAPDAVGVVESRGEASEVGVWRPAADGTLTAVRFRTTGDVWSVAGARSADGVALAGT